MVLKMDFPKFFIENKMLKKCPSLSLSHITKPPDCNSYTHYPSIWEEQLGSPLPVNLKITFWILKFKINYNFIVSIFNSQMLKFWHYNAKILISSFAHSSISSAVFIFICDAK